MISNNQTLNRIVKRLCSWGVKHPYKPRNKAYIGNSAPLFRNLYRWFFLVFVVLNVIVALFDILAYVINVLSISDLSDICFDLQETIFVGLFFACLNTLLYLYFWRLGYASDQEWSRYLIFMSVDLGVQLIGVLTVFVLMLVSAIQAWNKDCFEEARVSFVFLILALALSLLLCVIQGFSIMHMSRRMLLHNPITVPRKEEQDVIVLPD